MSVESNVEAHRLKVQVNELRDIITEILEWYSGDITSLTDWSDCMRRAHILLHGDGDQEYADGRDFSEPYEP